MFEEVEINASRPNVSTFVSQEVRERRTAAIACGPPGMVDETRDCVHSLLLEGFKGLEYVEKSYGW